MHTDSIDAFRADLDVMEEQEFSIHHWQAGYDETEYGRYKLTLTRLLGVEDEIRRMKDDGKESGSAWRRAQAQRRTLLDAATRLRAALPDVQNPDVRYQLDRELACARLRRKMFIDIITTGAPSAGFWDSMRRLPVEDRKAFLAFLGSREGEDNEARTIRIQKAASDWILEERSDVFLPDDRAEALGVTKRDFIGQKKGDGKRDAANDTEQSAIGAGQAG